MTRRYGVREEDPLADIITGFASLYVLYIFILYFADRVKFWHLFSYSVIVVFAVILLIICYRKIKQKRADAYFEKLLSQIRVAGQEEYVNNFISRFGLESKSSKGWAFRNYKFDFARVDDLEKVLREQGMELRHNDKNKDVYKILKYFIQEKEERVTRESIKKEPQKFGLMSGEDFEKLLYRLFEAMGYKMEYIGKTGDQGGDLIANKNGERVLIQAKCYRDWSVGNTAVQQVVGAMKYYDCNQTMVITTSANFTKEACALARVNHTELISKNQLSEWLLKYLKENWM